MDKTIVVGSPNITGNIGSCEVKSQNISLDSFHTQTIATNSCTGQIIAQNSYFDYSSFIFITFGIVFALVFTVLIGKIIVD